MNQHLKHDEPERGSSAARPLAAQGCHMERAHVLVRLRDGPAVSCTAADGICRTSATTVRLEHSEMSPGVASITFEQVFDGGDSNARVFQQSLAPAIVAAVDGRAATLVATGAPRAGKSFACHGDPAQRHQTPGLVTLALRHVFAELETRRATEWQSRVLLGCWGVGHSDQGEDELVDLLSRPGGDSTAASIALRSDDVPDMETLLVDRSVRVETANEAVHLYCRALARVQERERQDFALAVHVETVAPDGETRRGRFLAVDIHGSSIIEPHVATRATDHVDAELRSQPCFSDTQFPVHKPLSAAFGRFLGNESATYLLVAIQKPAQFQQQAIQSLLYACKAKEIRSTCAINYVSASAAKTTLHCQEQREHEENTPPAASTGSQKATSAGSCAFGPSKAASTRHVQLPRSSTLSPSLSTTSSDSASDLALLSPLNSTEDRPEAARSAGAGGISNDWRQAAVSRRVRKAYELAKATTASPSSSQHGECRTGSFMASSAPHAMADALLKHVPQAELQTLSLEDKLERIRVAHLELEQALARESAIKDKCVDRISRLSQSMSCQVAEHEKQLQSALAAKQAAEQRLQQTCAKFAEIGGEITRLQQQVKIMKTAERTSGHASSSDAASTAGSESGRSERSVLQTLSTRLETAMTEAKDVVEYKDGVIRALEERLQLASQRGAEAVTLLQQEQAQFQREKAELVAQLHRSEQRSGESEKEAEDAAKARAESRVAREQQAQLTVKVAQLTLELETARSQWTDDAREQEKRAEERAAARLATAEEEHAKVAAETQQQLAQLRRECDAAVVRQRVVSQAACKASELQREHLELELSKVQQKVAKQKLKLDKKVRVRVARAQQKHEQPLQLELADLTARLETAQRGECEAWTRLQQYEGDVSELKEQAHQLKKHMQRLEASNAMLEQDKAAVARRCETLEDAKRALEDEKQALEDQFDRRTEELEQSLVQQVAEAEARVHAERDREKRKLMKRHSAELLRRAAASASQERQSARPAQAQAQPTAEACQVSHESACSPSRVSSRASSSGDDASSSADSPRQQSIDDLDALIESKERRYRRGKQHGDSSASPPSSSSSSSSLKKALRHKDAEVAGLSARVQQLLTALATANEHETRAKKQTQQAEARRQEELARHEQLLEQLNRVKQENWSLSLALHVTETHQQQQQQQRTSPQTEPIY